MNTSTKTKPRIFYVLSRGIPEDGRSLTVQEQESLGFPYSRGGPWFVEPLPGRSDIGCLRTWDAEIDALDATLLVFPVHFGRTY